MNCHAVIIATGAQARWLGLPSEERFRGRGASACATCDGFFFRGTRVAVIGGGNSAVEAALYLVQLDEAVTLVHRRDSLRAERILQKRLRKHPRISVAWNAEIAEILGDDSVGVNAVRLRNTLTGEHPTLEVDGVFVAIGHAPATTLFSGQLSMRPGGYSRSFQALRPRACPESLLPETWPTTCSARRLLPPDSAAWQHWKPRAS